MASFQIWVKENKTYVISTTVPLCILIAGWFLNIAMEKKLAFLGVAIALLTLLLAIIFRKDAKRLSIFTLYGFLILASLSFYMHFFLAAVFLLVLAVVSFMVNRPKQIIIDESGILFPSFIPKKYGWKQVNQALLKDDILTIDLTSNHLLQLVFEENELTGIDTVAFNCFCKQQVEALNL
ncbi:MAG: hypothetical protein IPM10_07755 [Chitinophagaceae bacterium]|nr:hypothetical protein [Chitinophagaceae bacterium]